MELEGIMINEINQMEKDVMGDFSHRQVAEKHTKGRDRIKQ